MEVDELEQVLKDKFNEETKFTIHYKISMSVDVSVHFLQNILNEKVFCNMKL